MNTTFYNVDSVGNLVFETNVAGRDPKDLKVSHSGSLLSIGEDRQLRVNSHFDLTRAKCEYKFGILTVTVPPKVKVEIPVVVVDHGENAPRKIASKVTDYCYP